MYCKVHEKLSAEPLDMKPTQPEVRTHSGNLSPSKLTQVLTLTLAGVIASTDISCVITFTLWYTKLPQK